MHHCLLSIGTVGQSYKGDIAIDDVVIKDGSCGSPSDCNFESERCLWKNEAGDDFDWLRSKGSTNSRYTGPRIDHTFGTDSGKIRTLSFAPFLVSFSPILDLSPPVFICRILHVHGGVITKKAGRRLSPRQHTD